MLIKVHGPILWPTFLARDVVHTTVMPVSYSVVHKIAAQILPALDLTSQMCAAKHSFEGKMLLPIPYQSDHTTLPVP